MYTNIENMDLDFTYMDTDSHAVEMAELYTYSEEQEILNNRTAFEQMMMCQGFFKEREREGEREGEGKGEGEAKMAFAILPSDQRKRILEVLTDGMEVTDDLVRWRNIQSLFYLLQGSFGECDTLDQQLKNARRNVFDSYRQGIFPVLLQQLLWEIEAIPVTKTVCLADSFKLRTILGMIYTFVEVMRSDDDEDTTEDVSLKVHFTEELNQPVGPNEELLAIILFQLVTRFANNSAPVIPIRKVLLLLWKVLLVSLGGTDHLKKLKNLYRQEAGLLPEPDDTLEVVKTMRAASPPLNANDGLLEAQNQRKVNKPLKRQMFVKQSSVGGEESNELMIDQSDVVNEDDLMPDDGLGTSDSEGERSDSLEEKDAPPDAADEKVDIGGRPASPRPGTPNPGSLSRLEGDESEKPLEVSKSLPWVPKVRNKDIDSFMDYSRNKFVGYILPNNDRTTTAGLPEPILESINILNNHVYVSLTEIQTKKEEELTLYPLTMKEESLSLSSPTEALYAAMLPSLSQYMISLLKILLAAAPTSRSKTESLNVVSDVLPEEMPCSIVQSMKLGIDVNRHKEVMIKAISGILLLLLKHYKINHVYQFEYISQQLMFANCIPLVLKFFNQNVCQFVASKNTISVIDFPACVIGEQPELTAENLDVGEMSPWRNMFSCINLLRILNKLTKWKHSRIMMLVVFKSAPILKRALKLRHAMLQLYVLKLLKMQAKYLGRQWRKSNMKTMSAIYQKVRHRITDDWAYGNDMDSRPWDFQAEEFALQANINRFHGRRYGKSSSGTSNGLMDTTPLDNNLWSVLSKEVHLPLTFTRNYQEWMQNEVFDRQTDWDQLLIQTKTCM